MLILKRTNGTGEIFDTEAPDTATPSLLRPGPDKWLCNHHQSTDLAFLRQYFPEGHRIFNRFENSYYYLLNA